jgi:hypothetical protein
MHQLCEGIVIRSCYWLLHQALRDSAEGRVGPLFKRMMVSSDPRHERAGEQPNEAGRYGQGESKEAGPQLWARPLSASLAPFAERDRKLPPRDLECTLGHGPNSVTAVMLTKDAHQLPLILERMYYSVSTGRRAVRCLEFLRRLLPACGVSLARLEILLDLCYNFNADERPVAGASCRRRAQVVKKGRRYY